VAHEDGVRAAAGRSRELDRFSEELQADAPKPAIEHFGDGPDRLLPIPARRRRRTRLRRRGRFRRREHAAVAERDDELADRALRVSLK
jgi:hypothetical protein